MIDKLISIITIILSIFTIFLSLTYLLHTTDNYIKLSLSLLGIIGSLLLFIGLNQNEIANIKKKLENDNN